MLVRIPKAKLQHLSSAILALLLLSYSSFIAAQTLHRFGQSIQPIYEGFERNDDGTFTMWSVSYTHLTLPPILLV